MKFVLLFCSILFICVHSQNLKCFPSEFALQNLENGSVGDVNVTVTEYEDFIVYSSVGFILSNSNGGPNTSRGLLIIPDEHVHGGAYSPYARAMSVIGHHVVILKSITGLTQTEVFGKMVSAFETPLDLHAWALLGHGRGARLAAKFSLIDNGGKIKAVVLLGTELDNDMRNNKRNTILAYGLDDTIVLPTTVQDSVRSYGSYETNVNALPDMSHYDFAFSTCLGNELNDNEFRFESNLVPVLSLPAKTNKKEKINIESLVHSSDEQLNSCHDTKAEYLDDSSNWVNIANLFQIRSHSSELDIEVKTNIQNYEALKSTLNHKKVRIQIKCGNKINDYTEFYVSNDNTFVKPQSKGEIVKDTLISYANTAVGLLSWRAADQRGRYFTPDCIIVRNSTNPLVPVPTRWNVWSDELCQDSNAEVERAIIFFTGAAVEAQGYGGIANTLKEEFGYHVIIPSSVSRFSIPTAPQSISIVHAFPNVTKWTLSGHSVGSIPASLGYKMMPSYYDSIVMYSGNLGGNFMSETVPVINIFGTRDNANTGGYMRYINEFGAYNPDVTVFSIVPGANHYYTGDYGDQQDTVAFISREEQQFTYANITHNFLQNL